MSSIITEDDACPECGRQLNRVTCAEGDAAPEPGDISLCAYCGALNMFSEGIKLVPMPAAIFESLPLKTKIDIIRIRKSILARRDLLKVTLN